MRQEFPRQIAILGEVFDLLRRFGLEHQLEASLLLELGVVAEELFTNQVRHARPGADFIEVGLDLEGDVVRMEIIDSDVEPFDPTAVPEVETSAPAEERTPGGLGIHFIRQTCDTFEWDYDPDRRQSRITITRRRER